MNTPEPGYEPRYLAGIVFFNRQDYFEAHEVWEDLWAETASPERRFYQSLIQAAVCLYHFSSGNVRGAVKLFHSSKNYMETFAPKHLGLDVPGFWQAMTDCCADLLANPDPTRRIVPDPEKLPTLQLHPEPTVWPDPESFLPEE